MEKYDAFKKKLPPLCRKDIRVMERGVGDYVSLMKQTIITYFLNILSLSHTGRMCTNAWKPYLRWMSYAEVRSYVYLGNITFDLRDALEKHLITLGYFQ